MWFSILMSSLLSTCLLISIKWYSPSCNDIHQSAEVIHVCFCNHGRMRKGSKAQLKYSTGILRDRVGDSPRWQSVWYLTLNKCQRAVQSPASLSLSSSFYAYSLCRTGDDGFISPPLTTTRWDSFRCHIGCV